MKLIHMFHTPSKVIWLIGCLGMLGYLLLVEFLAPVAAQNLGPGESVNRHEAEGLGLGMIFTAFLVMLGPVKIVFPFAKLTSDLEEAEARQIGLKGFGLACVAGVVAAIIGQRILASWQISLSALHLTAGLVLLLVALKNTLAQYGSAEDTLLSPSARRNVAFAPLAFPILLTPYGIATFILILASTRDVYLDFIIFGLFLVVMTLNLMVMWYARAIIRRGGGGLALLGAVLSILQVALSIQMILDALRDLQVLPNL